MRAQKLVKTVLKITTLVLYAIFPKRMTFDRCNHKYDPFETNERRHVPALPAEKLKFLYFGSIGRSVTTNKRSKPTVHSIDIFAVFFFKC